jgi:GH25 family lysozyme M1 (1,4-beta-N-acetylmuramidase)
MILGLDLSQYDTPIKLQQAKNNGVKFSINQICNGYGALNKYWNAHYYNCQEAGIFVGAYQYWQADLAPIRQADNFLNLVSKYPNTTMYVIDAEDWLDINKVTVTPQKISERARLWVEYVNANTDKKVMIYTGKWFLYSYALPMLDWIYNHPLWLAYYPITFPYGVHTWETVNNAVGKLTIDQMNQTLPNLLKNRWQIWQMAVWCRPPSFYDYPDMNVFNGTDEELQAFFSTQPFESVHPIPLKPYDVKIISWTGVKVRLGASLDTPRLAGLPYKFQTTIYEEQNGFGRIQYPMNGWITLDPRWVEKIPVSTPASVPAPMVAHEEKIQT